MRAKTLAWLGMLSLLLASCSFQDLLPSRAPAAAPTEAVLNEIQGLVALKNPGGADFAPAAGGAKLQVGGQVRTGADSRARLELSTGTLVRLAGDTQLTLAANQADGSALSTSLTLEAGQVWASLKGGSLTVDTPTGRAAVRGSYLGVRIDPQSGDVWVDCMEGACQAGNPTSSLDLVAGEGAVLHPAEAGGTPLAPELRRLTESDLIQFIAVNPEAQGVVGAAIATASLLPSLTPRPSATRLPCFTLTSPQDGIVLPESGPFLFTWTDLPGRYKFIFTMINPDGKQDSTIVMDTSYERKLEELPAGTYQWKVTAYDAQIQSICSAGPFSFSKAAISQPTATAEPPTEIPVDTATPTPAACISPLTPADGTNFTNEVYIDFTWTAYPNAYKYILSIKPPKTVAVTFLAMTPQHRRYMESLPAAGTYQWWVTAKDEQLHDLCTSPKFSFTKGKTFVPSSTPSGSGGDLFWGQNGPTGAQSTCGGLSFSVNSSNPNNAMVKVIFSITNLVPDGNSDPHEILNHGSGTLYSGTFDFSGKAGKTVYWRFALYDGSYTHDTKIYSFSCP